MLGAISLFIAYFARLNILFIIKIYSAIVGSLDKILFPCHCY